MTTPSLNFYHWGRMVKEGEGGQEEKKSQDEGPHPAEA